MSITSRGDRGRHVYVAAHFYMWSEVRYWYYELEKAGHHITYEWARKDAPGNLPEDQLIDDILRTAGERDLSGIERADLVVWLADNKDMLGAPIEAGYALRGKQELWVVDPYRRCPFFLVAGANVMTRAEAAKRLGFDYDKEVADGRSRAQARVS